MRVVGAVVAALVAVVAVVRPLRRTAIEWFTRVNGTWVGVPPVPVAESPDAAEPRRATER